jgi:hypothetical protein
VDAATTPPKVLVDEIRTDFTMYVSADENPTVAPKPVQPVAQPVSQPRPMTPAPPPPANRQPQPVQQTPQRPPSKVAEPPADYVPAPDDEFDDMPPEPEFPDDWHLGELTVPYAAPPTPMDDLLEMERLAPLANGQKPVANSNIDGPKSNVVHNVQPIVSIQPLVIEASVAKPTVEMSPLLPPIAPPVILEKPVDEDRPPRIITIFMHPTNDNDRDRRRIKNVYGILISAHGKDRFQFQVFENGRGHLIDFPNDTTRICADMLDRLRKLMGEEAWRIEEITYQ